VLGIITYSPPHESREWTRWWVRAGRGRRDVAAVRQMPEPKPADPLRERANGVRK
jgi:hypothetical protein